MSSFITDTIVAQATPPGQGGVGIIRVSGPAAADVAQIVLGKLPAVRRAEYLPFTDHEGQPLDQGIALFFKAPNSFTGEDVLELQGHGGPIVLNMLLNSIRTLPNIRLARPGEFSERAFLNDKIDLAQAEAIADLIESSSEQAARSAMHSLQGVFSNRVNALVERLIQLRMYVEAAIDFPEEEVDFLSDSHVSDDLQRLIDDMAAIRREAKQGSLLREGMKVVLAGRPNAGKSSLLNALAGRESAIVTDIAGTTRDVLREHIHIDGMPLHLIDTAGLRVSGDAVEKIGIERAWNEIKQADRILLVVDATQSQAETPEQAWADLSEQLPPHIPVTILRNKIDLTEEQPGLSETPNNTVIRLSAHNEQDIDRLRDHLKQSMGFTGNTEGGFIARERHLAALENAAAHLDSGHIQLHEFAAGELLAEELRLAQQALEEISGRFSSDDLLSKIFSSFCIGK